jgi:hypothetical protein
MSKPATLCAAAAATLPTRSASMPARWSPITSCEPTAASSSTTSTRGRGIAYSSAPHAASGAVQVPSARRSSRQAVKVS